MKTAFAIVFCLTVILGPFANEHPKLPPVMDESELKSWYEFDNRKFFDNQLDPNVTVHYTNMPNPPEMGHLEIRSHGPDDIAIVRSVNNTNNSVRLTLFHEMCHEEEKLEFEDHGPRWEACMERIAVSGGMHDLW